VIQSVLLHPTYFSSIVQFAVNVQFEGKVIWEVCDTFQKQTYRNRTFIVTDKGKLLLSIPIKHNHGKRQFTREVVSDPSERWNDLHWKSIVTAYRSSPFFEFYESELQPLYNSSSVELIKHTLKTHEFLCHSLGILPPIKTNNSYQKVYNDSEIIDLRSLVNAKEPNPAIIRPYPQVFDNIQPFISGASVLDLLFNTGPKETKSYLSQLDLSSLF
jgi:hypothetical protein